MYLTRLYPAFTPNSSMWLKTRIELLNQGRVSFAESRSAFPKGKIVGGHILEAGTVKTKSGWGHPFPLPLSLSHRDSVSLSLLLASLHSFVSPKVFAISPASSAFPTSSSVSCHGDVIFWISPSQFPSVPGDLPLCHLNGKQKSQPKTAVKPSCQVVMPNNKGCQVEY